MNIVKAEYTFDASKIIFFFLADGRVDFRNLVKDLAKVFRVRIELKQIGVRDKAKIVGGYGICVPRAVLFVLYEKFSCAFYQNGQGAGTAFEPVAYLGVSVRIKCCMAYEFQVYKEFSKDLPSVGEKVTIEEGKGKVIDVNILKRLVTVDVGEGKIIKTVFEKAGVG